jgi:hypothetical protein
VEAGIALSFTGSLAVQGGPDLPVSALTTSGVSEMSYPKMLEDRGFEVVDGRKRFSALLTLHATVKAIDQDGKPYRIFRAEDGLQIEPSPDENGDVATPIVIRPTH